jgi:hypothetical protein
MLQTEKQETQSPPLPQLPTPECLAVHKKRNAELEDALVRGDRPDPEALAGWRFRGLNTPSWSKYLGIQKFMKGFYKHASGALFGYNVPVEQNGIGSPWIAKGKPFGFYAVTGVDPSARDNAYLHALLLDYGAGGNARFDPTATLRDYLVRVRPGSDDLLLGKAYVALGPLRVFVQSFFILERHERSEGPGARR